MLTVACVKWGDKYGSHYVTKLRSMCRRHLPTHRFVCFTENPVDDIECLDLPSNLPGWWAKVGLFRPGLFSDDVLYLDLDIVISGDLYGMVELLDTDRKRLWAPDDFSYSLVHPRSGLSESMRRLLGGDGTVNSSVMMWHGDAPGRVWDEFTIDKMTELHGDQNWISQCLWPNINLIPGEWIRSYKYHGPLGPLTVFHGNPKPADVREPLVTDHWR